MNKSAKKARFLSAKEIARSQLASETLRSKKPNAMEVVPVNTKAMAIAKDPKKAEAFLIKAGIITHAGKLAPEYTT